MNEYSNDDHISLKTRITNSSIFWGMITIILIVSIWEFCVRVFEMPAYILPTPTDVWFALVAGVWAPPTSRASFWFHLSITLTATLSGFALGSILGVLLAMLMAEFDAVRRAIFPAIVGFQSLPKVAIAPLYIIWFGFNIESKIAMAATLCFFPVMLNSLQGFLTVENERLELMTSLNAGRWQTFWRIKLPGALPFVFAGLNLGIVYAFLGAIVAEFIGAQNGVGVIVTQLQSLSDTAGVFAVLVLLGISGYVLIAIMSAIHRRVVFWSGEVTKPVSN